MMALHCLEALRIIHETIEVQQGGIIGTLVNMLLWCCGFLKPNQWSQDTAADAKWTNADYQIWPSTLELMHDAVGVWHHLEA